jgi:hypothetical protein
MTGSHMGRPGRVLGGRYELGEVLGRGGMSVVHRGFDRRTGREVAVKVFQRGLDLVHEDLRYRREILLLSGLSDPGLVTVFDADLGEAAEGEADEPDVTPYLVTELVDGQTATTAATVAHRYGRLAIYLDGTAGRPGAIRGQDGYRGPDRARATDQSCEPSSAVLSCTPAPASICCSGSCNGARRARTVVFANATNGTAINAPGMPSNAVPANTETATASGCTATVRLMITGCRT